MQRLGEIMIELALQSVRLGLEDCRIGLVSVMVSGNIDDVPLTEIGLHTDRGRLVAIIDETCISGIRVMDGAIAVARRDCCPFCQVSAPGRVGGQPVSLAACY